MFVFLSKLLPVFIYPLGLVILLVAGALLLQRKKRLQRFLLILALLVVLAGSNRMATASLVRALEYRYPLAPELEGLGSQPPEAALAPVIVLLGGGTESDSSPRPMVEVNGAGDRVLYAAQLYRQGAAPKILVTGGSLDWTATDTTPAEDMAELLQFLGVPPEAIWLEGASRNTYENAVFTKDLLAQAGIHKIILVTSAQHMPRAVALFRHQGLEVLPAPADFSLTEAEWQKLTHPRPVDLLFNILPNAGSLEATTNALKEFLGMLVYRWRGWM